MNKFVLLIISIFLATLLPKHMVLGKEKRLQDSASWNICKSSISRIEKKTGIPNTLLQDIAIIKSGRKSRYSNGLQAWPWTITVHGHRLFFESQDDAIAELTALIAEGWTTFKVGCLQTNFEKKNLRFLKISSALEPTKNALIAAELLKRIREEGHDWDAAADLFVAEYFPTQTSPYTKLFHFKMNPQLENKIASAGISIPIDRERTRTLNQRLQSKRQIKRKSQTEKSISAVRRTQLSNWRKNRVNPEALAQILAVRLAENTKRQEQKIKELMKRKEVPFSEYREQQLTSWRKKMTPP